MITDPPTIHVNDLEVPVIDLSDGAVQRAAAAINAAFDSTADDDSTPEALARAALRAAGPYHGHQWPTAPSLTPVEVRVVIDDEAGLEVEQVLNLTREQASRPETLGGAVGQAVVSVLAAFHIADDGTAADDARAAAGLQLRGSS